MAVRCNLPIVRSPLIRSRLGPSSSMAVRCSFRCLPFPFGKKLTFCDDPLYKVNTEQNINNILLINMTQSCQIKHFTCILHLLNNTCVKYNFKSVHVSNLFWNREYNSAKEICKYPSFSKVGGNYPLDLKIIWSSDYNQRSSWGFIKYFIFLHFYQSAIFERK